MVFAQRKKTVFRTIKKNRELKNSVLASKQTLMGSYVINILPQFLLLALPICNYILIH